MPIASVPDFQRSAGRASGRCTGALLFCGFGSVWLTLALYAFSRLHWPAFLGIVALFALLATFALRLSRRLQPAAAREPPHPRRKQDDRTFLWINLGQGIAIFLLFFTLPRLGHQEIAVPAAVIVVGLHFLIMPPLYRSPSNLVLGVAMVVWGLLCLVVFRGDRMIAFAALGAGLMLWTQAGWALRTAHSIARHLAL